MNAMFTCVGIGVNGAQQIRNNAFGVSAPQLYRPIRMFVIRDYSTIPDPCIVSVGSIMTSTTISRAAYVTALDALFQPTNRESISQAHGRV